MFHCPFHSCLSHIRTGFTLCFTFLLTTLVATRRCRCLLRSDKGWVVMPFGLRHVISGILAGGIPGFRMVLCCFSHLCVWPCVCLFSPFCFVCFLAFLAILGCDDTMLPSPAWIHQWTGCQSFLCVRFWLVLVLLFGFVCCLVLFCVSLLFAWFLMMTAQWTMYRSSPSSLLRPSTVDGLEH